MATDERLTWNQICERHPERFVVLVDHDRLPHDAAGFNTARVYVTERYGGWQKARVFWQNHHWY